MHPDRIKQIGRSEVLQWIIVHILRPIMLKFDFDSIITFLEKIFNISTRTIERYYVKKTFYLRGQKVGIPNKPEKGLTKTKVTEGTYIMVRHDATRPNYYDVEMINRKGEDTWFRIDRDKWSQYEFFYLTYYPFKKERRKRVYSTGRGNTSVPSDTSSSDNR